MKYLFWIIRRLVSQRRFIFIIAVGRDGSTLLQSVLNSSRLTLVRGENAFVLEAASALAHHAAHRTSLVSTPPTLFSRILRSKFNNGHPWFGITAIRFDTLIRSLRKTILRDVIRPLPWHRTVGFKEVRWADFPHCLGGLELLFPKARYLILHRDPLEVAKSGWWQSLPDSFEEVKRRQRTLREMAEVLGERALTVNYADFSQGGPKVKAALEEFLDLRISSLKWRRVLSRPLIHQATTPPWVY